MSLKKQLEESMLGPSRERNIAFQSGKIVSSYYDKKNSRSSQAYVDIIMFGQDGNVVNTFVKVPMIKIGGMSISLPISGTYGVLGFLDGDMGKPFLIGTFESILTDQVTLDNVSPVSLPSSLTS